MAGKDCQSLCMTEPGRHGREGLSMNGINIAGTRVVNYLLDSSPSSLNFSIISPVEHDGILGVTTSKLFSLHLVELPLKLAL